MAQVKDSTRSRDRASQEFQWVDPKILFEFPEGHALAGHQVAYLDDPADTAQLGALMGHCAGTHFIWTSEERIWYFFSILGPNGQPHVTVHAKQTKWLNKFHPRDNAPSMPVHQGYGSLQACPKCRGFGGHKKDGTPYYFGERDTTIPCADCKGTGRLENNPKGVVRASSGGYPAFADVLAAFESIGQQYEAGKYKPLQFTSTTYDGGVIRASQRNSWGYHYGQCMARPKHVTDEQWNAYTKLWKAMGDTFDKEEGAVVIEGRQFKFDNKHLTILSFSGKGQADAPKYRKGFHEWLVELAKAKKEVASGS